jgi:hypothetical protein
MTVDTILIRGPFRGNQNDDFGWSVTKNNSINFFEVQLYFVGKDTINYNIEY